MININNRPMSSYKMSIRNVASWLRSKSDKEKDLARVNSEEITIFHAAPVLAAAFAMNQKDVMQDLIQINEIDI